MVQNKYVWLFKQLELYGCLTRKEISELWQEEEDYHAPIPRSTFNDWLRNTEEMFHISIECNHSTKKYFIAYGKKYNDIMKLLVNSLLFSDTLVNTKGLDGKILPDYIPEGEKFLSIFIEAIKERKTVEMTYQKYQGEDSYTFLFNPYCVKQDHQRWYVVGYSHIREEIRIFALDDRMKSARITQGKFHYPKEFKAKDYFKDFYGVVTKNEVALEHIVLRATGKEQNYIASAPLHNSQHIEEKGEGYTDYGYDIRPTYDFKQAILSRAQFVEVLQPESLREEIATTILEMSEKYRK